MKLSDKFEGAAADGALRAKKITTGRGKRTARDDEGGDGDCTEGDDAGATTDGSTAARSARIQTVALQARPIDAKAAQKLRTEAFN